MILDVEGKLYACEGEDRRVVSYEEGLETELISDSFEGMAFNEPNDLAVHPNKKSNLVFRSKLWRKEAQHQP